MRKWIPIIILASGQFVMTLDTSVMNVSISQITADLNTSIQGVQAAITLYALVMAALMLTGAKLGDIYGRNRMFAIGLAVYGAGSLITALSPNLTVLLVGWSGIEGFGAIMVIPGIAALTAANYQGKDRALAYALIGGITAVAVAAGPLIGGWVTTNASWRYVFAGETVIVTVIILVRGQIAQAPKAEHPPKLDVIGSVLSVAGLGLAVFGILMGSKWGFVRPLGAPTINGTEITPLGFSVVPFMVLAGLGILAGFVHWEERRHRLGLDRLLDTALLKITQLRAGLDHADGPAAGADGALLRRPGLPAGRGRAGRVRDGQAAASPLRGDADRRDGRAQGGGKALAEDGRAGGPRPDQRRGRRDAGHARREAQRHRVQDRHGPGRRRRGAPRLAARQRDHVVDRLRPRRARPVACRGPPSTSGPRSGPP